MARPFEPADYEAWYHTRRGAWIGQTEFALLMNMLRPATGASLLDVGSGSGYFSRGFATAGLQVTGIDPDPAMLAYASQRHDPIRYLQGSAQHLPYADQSFDYVSAITSLCFIEPPTQALMEIWRVCRRAVVLGLLNRHSLLYHAKHDRQGYVGARWDTVADVRQWLAPLLNDSQIDIGSAIFLPNGNRFARIMEHVLSHRLPYGGFLAVKIRRI